MTSFARQFDLFFSLTQTPVNGIIPSEQEMYKNFLMEVEAADRLGFGVAWIAESHLSIEVQKTHQNPVVPHWKGEIGVNSDTLQLANLAYRKTKRIELGTAILNILCNGGPIAHAERIANFLSLHGLDEEEKRKIHIGFSSGRFDFMNRASGIQPKTELEKALPHGLWKGQVFSEATEIFVRLIAGEAISSDDISLRNVTRANFRSEADWTKVIATLPPSTVIDENTVINVPKQFVFDVLKIIPHEFRRELLQLAIGSHDKSLQEYVNKFIPAHVLNLSITPSSTIEDTHKRMEKAFNPEGGPWKRSYMPRTVLVFINEEEGLTPIERSQTAKKEAVDALSAYWDGLEGTIDSEKVEKAADNSIIGTAQEVANQIVERYHPEDRLMLWFDLFNHDSSRVIRNMEAFMNKVVPLLAEKWQKT